MLFLQTDFDRVMNNKEREPWKTLLAKLIDHCDSLAANPFPESDRTRHNWTLERARVLLDVTASLGVCYKLTGEIKYARRTIEFLLESIDWELWFYKTEVTDCSPYDLGTAETAMAFAIALPLIRDAISGEEHNFCLKALDRRVLTVYLENTAPGDIKVWWHNCLNNWNCVCNGGQLAISAYMQSCGYETERAAVAIDRALKGLKVYFDAMHGDGSCEEGVGYWGYATKYFTMALLYWENATGEKHSFFDTEKCAKWLRFPFVMSSGNAALGFCDSNCVFSCEMAYAYAARINDAATLVETAALLRSEEYENVWSLMFTRGGSPTPEPGVSPAPGVSGREVIWYPDNGWAVFRSGEYALSFRSGSTEVSHSQKDLQSIQLARGGEALLENIGNHPYPVGWFGSYRGMYWEENTTSKNAPLFNGIGQDHLATAVFEREGDRIVSEAAAAYPDFITRVWRGVGFSDEGVFCVDDELEAKQEMYHELRFLSPGCFKRISANKARVERGGQSAELCFKCGEAFDIWIGETLLSVPVHPVISILRVFTTTPVLRTVWKTIIC